MGANEYNAIVYQNKIEKERNITGPREVLVYDKARKRVRLNSTGLRLQLGLWKGSWKCRPTRTFIEQIGK